MGLGKTLTMISLILRQKELDPPPPPTHDLWLSKTVKIKRSDGTLVVCPASVVGKFQNQFLLILYLQGKQVLHNLHSTSNEQVNGKLRLNAAANAMLCLL